MLTPLNTYQLKRPAILIFLFLWFRFLLPAQQSVLYYHELNSQNKLSQTVNEFVFQDSRGFVWISSFDGLNRFDGQNVEVYKPDKSPNSILGQNIQSNFFEDKLGNIWFSTYEAINCFRPNSNDFLHFQFQKGGKKINTDYHVFHLDKNSSKLWVKIGKAIFTFDTQRHHFSDTIVHHSDGFRYLIGKKSKTDQLETIWDWSFDGQKLRQTYPITKGTPPITLDFKPSRLQKAIILNSDSIWVLTTTGLYCVNRNIDGTISKQAILPLGISASEVPLSMIALSPAQLLFWMPDGRLVAYHIKKNRLLRTWYLHAYNPPINSELLGRNMYLDPYNNLWLSIPGLGLRYANLNRNLFEYLPLTVSPTGQDKSKITTIGTLNSGKIVFTDIWQGLFIYDSVKGITRPNHSALLKNVEVYSSLIDKQDNIYLFTAANMYKYNGQTNDLIDQGKNTNQIVFATTLRNQQTLAGSFKMAPLVDLSSSVQKPKAMKGLDHLLPYFNCMYLDQKGTYFLPFNDEYILACRMVKDSFVIKKKIEIRGAINGYVEDLKKNKIWVASSYGLYVINTTNLTWEAVYTNDQSTQQSIQSILTDQLGRLWLGTNNGLARYDPEAKKSRIFEVVDGLPDNAFTPKACIATNDGKMLFATSNGLVSFDPLQELLIKDEPKIVLLEFNAIKQRKGSLQKAIINQKINLPFRSNTISFRFQGIEYADPEHVELYYSLEPAEKGRIKIDNAQGKVRYPNLPAGQYTLKLHAKSAAGIWAKEPLVYHINIATPFQQTIFFWVLMTAVVGWGGLQAFKYYSNSKLNTQLAKQNLIEAERNRMMEDLHDGIGSDLTAIKAISEKFMLTTQDQPLQEKFRKILTRSQEAIRTMSEITRATDEQYSALSAFLEWVREKVEEFIQDVGMEINIELPTVAPEIGIGAEARQNVWFVIKETLNNMAKHANADRAELRVFLQSNLAIFEIQDNGIGFKMDSLRKGRGMRNMPKRMKNIKGTFLVLPQQQGTLVELKVPIGIILQPTQSTWKRNLNYVFSRFKLNQK
jgi:signal transduction histidine kinase/ligand-binding sensor domain-containing protein